MRVWSVSVSRTACQSVNCEPLAAERPLRAATERVGGLGVGQADADAAAGPVTSAAHTIPGSQRG